MDSTPPFTLDGSRYDLSTYWGRFLNFVEIIDPRMMLVGSAEVQEAQALLSEFEGGELDASNGETTKRLWDAKKIRESATNGGTGELIFPAFRMAAFVPMNVPLVAGMLNAQSVSTTLFWQWANQSFNSATNYANRSGSDMSMKEIMTSYGIAVGTSCGLALGFRWLGNHGPTLFRKATKIPFVVPYISVAGAGAANVFFSRKPEIENGVMIKDASGRDLGISKEAGKQGVMKTILSRSLGLPIPVLVVPSVAMAMLPKTLPKRTLVVAELIAITSSLCFALPATLAIFPQKMELSTTSLEPEFQNLKDTEGNPIEKVYCNKGL